ncbi:MAG TPA: aminotransferase class V-fold PLP-dependent enzyme [Nocardioidaceae bacterium]|nr:aminotransferase class V-fold PLP-dependent enzyme [Nocardioidaceae bacterium]
MSEFEADRIYLDTASMGLAPRRTLEALQRELDTWRRGKVRPQDFDHHVARARTLYAGLVGVDPGWVATGPQASVYAGLVAASLPADAVVLVAANEFTSITFPFLARGLTVREVPLAELADAVSDDVTLVSVAAVQSADGALADLSAVESACRAHGVRTLVDFTQAAGWLPVDASRYDYTLCSAYKWLLSPRGTCFFTVRPERWDEVVPLHAGWYAGADPWTSIYGTPLRLAEDARRFDVSPAWHSMVGTASSLELLTEIGRDELHRHSAGLADAFCDAVGLPAQGSAIVSVATNGDLTAVLEEHGIAASVRAGRLRLAFHVCNSTNDVAMVAAAVGPHLA